MSAPRRIRVLVVDDSVVVRRLVSDVLSADEHIEVVGTAVNGRLGVAKVDLLQPDLVTLDVEMPEMDGLAALRAIRAKHKRLPVIMFSTLTEPGAAVALEALASGASDYVTKPANVGSVAQSMQAVSEQLIPRVHALAGAAAGLGRSAVTRTGTAPVRPSAPSVGHTAVAPRRASAPGVTPKVLAIGCSTGGPQALAGVLEALPASFPVPVVVVQHMPPVFTAQFAARLDRSCKVRVLEAQGGEVLAPGTVYIAPGDFHMELEASATPVVRLNQKPAVCFCRPAVDVLFASVAACFGAATLAVVLTGMGHDGREGARRISTAGGSVLVQDERTSVVWGMPGAIAAAGLADEILPLDTVATAILKRVGPGATSVLSAASSTPTLASSR
ncbi:protein-glutamate methylesterase/protein-glutamine glutaminase [Jatrophihabitans fulvus]